MRVRPWVCINTVAAASMLAMASSSFGGGSNCCTAWGGIGCDNASCQATVCGFDSFCCSIAWDSVCAGEAASSCGALCSGGGSNCCTAWGGIGCDNASCQATVCGFDSFCCAIAWDSICAGEAASSCGSLCSGGGFTCTGGDCCTASGGIGCNNTDCCNTVCSFDSFCCAIAWDSVCAGEAASSCGDLCGGGGFTCTGGDCCSASGGIGCNDVNCCNTVCSFDSFCCAIAWDSVCAGEAASSCGDLCGGGGFNCTGGDCCSASGGLGCNNADCCNTVCSFDSFCCAVAWDTVCAGEAASNCGDLCGGGGGSNCCTAWGGIGCDNASCEATVCGFDSFCCSIAWDSVCAGEAASSCGSLCSGGGFTCTGGDCCTASGGIGCNNIDCCNTVCSFDSFCCAIAWDSVCAGEAAS
ncbi:MAG: hypothetical protein U0572_09575, partial [Phycisphaerales bacterium]